MAGRVTSDVFGHLPTGEPVESFTLDGAGGLSLRAITLGGIVTRLLVPDRRGDLADVVLGFGSLDKYLGPHPFFGAIAGRVAGRISGAKFTLDGETYDLEANDPPNHLHGGSRGFDKQLWAATQAGPAAVRFHRVSPDGEAGYPGAVDVAVTYTVTDDNRFVIDVEATTDQPTPFGLTHHSYFNLAGEGSGTVEDHELRVFADEVAAVDEHFTLAGRRELVDGLPGNLRRPRRLGDVIPHLQARHGDLYLLGRRGIEMAEAARLVEPTSGRVMSVVTDEDCLQFYTGVKLDGSLVGKSGRPYHSLGGLCLECEGYPDGANVPALGDVILRPGQTLRKTTEYAFSIC